MYKKGLIKANNKTELNRFKLDNEETYIKLIESKEYKELGIARSVTRNRLKKVIKGYVTNRRETVPPKPNNLTYMVVTTLEE